MSPESVHDLIRHLEDELDTILWPHHTDIGGHVGFGPPDARLGGRATKRARSGPVRTTVTLVGRYSVPLEDDPPIRVVGSDDVVSCPRHASFHEPQRSIHDPVPVWEASLEELRAEVVVIENEGRPIEDAKEDPYGPEEVRGIATLHHVESIAEVRPEAELQGHDERV